jgi:hypothetical protein
MQEDDIEYSPYCKICDACGEDGCCSAASCKQHPDGHYCKGYLKELKFGYLMYKELMNLVGDDPRYEEMISKKWNDLYDQIFIDQKDNE